MFEHVIHFKTLMPHFRSCGQAVLAYNQQRLWWVSSAAQIAVQWRLKCSMQYCWHNTLSFEIPITTAPWIRSRAKRLGSYFNVPSKTYWASTMVLWIDRELIQLSQYIDLCEIWWCVGVNKYILYDIIYILYIHIRERESTIFLGE